MFEQTYSRRAVLRAGAAGAAALAAGVGLGPSMAEADVTQETPLPQGRYTLDGGWLFGGVYSPGSEQPGYPESGFVPVSLPHTVTSLSWGNWNPDTWEAQWIYRLHISQAAVSGGRVFIDFQGVMTSATVYLNGAPLAIHQGGFLPFSVELTESLIAGDNVLAVMVDSTVQDVPPMNPGLGAPATDYLMPGGIYRDVRLRISPEVQIADVFAKPSNVLTSPYLAVGVTLDAAATSSNVVVTATLTDSAGATAGTASQTVAVQRGRTSVVWLTMPNLNVGLWSPETPTLYTVTVTATLGQATDQFAITTGFREAVFQLDGFYLNGSRYEIFGVNRHQLFPYGGMAAPARLQARDAAILKYELNCNMVRCSHYPQSEYFLDACDALGIMVWQEPPGWGYVGDGPFREIAMQNVEDMILRDRSRPSVIVWAVRLNETNCGPTNQALYADTNQIAAVLDGTRQTTGAMDIYSTSGWNQQVFAYDDYQSINDDHAQATLYPPIPGVPYMVSESVGAIDGAPTYLWIDPQATLALQGVMHAEVHNIAQGNDAYAGLLGWCGIDYQSLNGGDRIWSTLKSPGVIDTFRVPKPAAGFYGSQCDPSTPVIVPTFFWDFGPASPSSGPGPGTVVFTNCDELHFYVGDAKTPTITGTPDSSDYPNLAYPPVVVDFPTIDGTGSPALKIEGIVNGNVVTTLQMSSDTGQDQLQLTLDDTTISADGTDATRFTVRGVDAYGNHRPLASTNTTEVAFSLSGPATLIADNPFEFGTYGGVGGGFLQSQAGATGQVTLSATHPTLGSAQVALTTVAGAPASGSAGSSLPRVLTDSPVPDGPPRRPRPQADVESLAWDNLLKAELRRLLVPHGFAARIEQILRHGYQLSFRAPSPGVLVIGWYRVTRMSGRGTDTPRATAVSHVKPKDRVKRVLVASASVHIHSPGRVKVHVRLTARGTTLLRHARDERLEAEASFTPAGKGERPVSVSRSFTLRR